MKIEIKMAEEEVFRKLLIKHRRLKKMTTIQLGKIVGLHNSSISRLEMGQKRPYLDQACKISRALGFKIYIKI